MQTKNVQSELNNIITGLSFVFVFFCLNSLKTLREGRTGCLFKIADFKLQRGKLSFLMEKFVSDENLKKSY